MPLADLKELLSRLNKYFPGRVAMVGLTNLEMSRFSNPPLTTIDVPAVEMGITAARIITSRVRGDTTLPKRVLLPSRLIERDSV